MDALLEFRGRNFAVDSALASSPWSAHAKVWHRGDSTGMRSRPVYEDSGFNIRFGGGEDAKLERQIEEVLVALQRQGDEIRRIRMLPDIESACVRFGDLWPENIVARFPRLPNELLLHCGRLGLDIVLCEYLSSDEPTDPGETA